MSRAKNRPSLVKESAKGDGNCAFNAWVLAFSSQETLDGIENELKRLGQAPDQALANFIPSAAQALSVAPNWASVKTAVLQGNRHQLQRLLAPIMRHLAIMLAEQDAVHIERTKEPIQSAFSDYVRTRLGMSMRGERDDVYSKHAFIVEQFEALFLAVQAKHGGVSSRDIQRYNQLNAMSVEERTEEQTAQLQQMDAMLDKAIQDAKAQLLIWWEGQTPSNPLSHYQHFLAQMKKEGQWAGDLELFQLARYFHVNLHVVRHDFTHVIHFDQGALPRKSPADGYALSQADCDQLMIRGVVQPVGSLARAHSLRLLPLSPEELSSRLARVPDFERVSDHIRRESAAFSNVARSIVPSGLSPACHQQLVQRNVINRRNDGQYRFSNLSNSELEQRIEAVKGAVAIEAACLRHRSASPVVVLANESAVHWDNMRPAAPAKATPHTLYGDTLGLLTANKIQVDPNKWNALIEKAKMESLQIAEAKESAVSAGSQKPVTQKYQLPGLKKEIEVSVETQEALDEALAKKLQLEEYEKYQAERSARLANKRVASDDNTHQGTPAPKLRRR